MKAARSQGQRRTKASKSVRSLYAKARREFTAADLQRYTETEAGVPASKVLAEMESIQRKSARKRSAR